MGGIGLVDREEGEYLGEGRGLRVVLEDVVLADNGGELGASYVGGGTKDALTRSLDEFPASSAAWRSLAYLSWNVRRMLISMATALRSADIPFSLGLGGWVIGWRPQIIRAKSCWCSGINAWISGTVCDQTIRKGRNAGGQLERERSLGVILFAFVNRGRGTDGGLVVDLRAAKYKHNAGPTYVQYEQDNQDQPRIMQTHL